MKTKTKKRKMQKPIVRRYDAINRLVDEVAGNAGKDLLKNMLRKGFGGYEKFSDYDLAEALKKVFNEDVEVSKAIFKDDDVRKLYGSTSEHPWYFSDDIASLICEITGLEEPYSNNEVEDLFEKNGVVSKTDQSDAESSCFYVNFKSQEDGVAFIGRLNKFFNKLRARKAEASKNIYNFKV